MLKFGTSNIGVTQGEYVLFSDYIDDGLMWSGSGNREIRVFIDFSEPFSAPPMVHVGMAMWDVAVDANNRLDLMTKEISTTGFVVVFKTWADTHIARARMNWIAIGEVDDPELWKI